MAKQILTGGNGTSGQTGQQVIDIINSNFTELYSGVWLDMGGYDASGDGYPTTGGSGTSGAIMRGNTFEVTTASTTDGLFPLGSTLRALTDSPGQTSTNWKVMF
jgi:hypothetical protein